MKRWHVFTCILAACAMMPALTGAAQDQGQSGSSQYQPAVPAPTTVNTYGGYPLLEDSFAPERGQIEQLLAKKASQGALSITDEMAARQAIESMFADLKVQIKQLPPMDYVQARDFLQSMIYATAHSTLH